MSVWMWLLVVVSAPIALLGTLLGVLHVFIAVGWVWSGEERPSAVPLVGILLTLVLLGLSLALDPSWARIALFAAAIVCTAGEVAILAARGLMALRRRRPTPRA